MATETKHFAVCDRCGGVDETDTVGETPKTWCYIEVHVTNPEGTVEELGYDLCTDCKQEFYPWLRRRQDRPA